jgi:asparagine synthase (glutamine-hydrolysing)
MCGIAGFTGNNKDLLHKMLNSIEHRGPDGEGMEVNEDFSIGMRRLAIIDPNGGWQPIYNRDGSVCIVFNGEIYNYEEIWKELKELGYEFKTDHSDTETILHGYEAWGEKVLDKLTGMFAFAIYDASKQELFVARDRLGIKPLYYHQNGSKVTFASEIKVLFQDTDIPRRPNLSVLYEFLMYRVHDSREETFFEGVKRLLPGHYMILDKNGIKKIERYWYPTYNTEFQSKKSDDAYAEEFYALFKKVMRRHLISDVPVGVSLSGGLDSSGVSCVMHELMKEGTNLHTNGKLHTFSAVFPNQSIDESEYIHEVEKYIGSEPHYAYPKVEEFWDEIMEWVFFQEEPTISSAPYAYYSVYREAHKHVKVMLSGNGGDELLAGYVPYFRAYMTSALDQRHFLAGAREFIKGWDIYKKFVKDAVSDKLNPKQPAMTMKEMLAETYQHGNPFKFTPSRNLNERLLQDVTRYSTPNLLRYEDKNSMAFSIESRVPFLDHELVEYIFQLPMDQKIKKGWNRAIYRNAMKGHMPDKNRLRRNKIGFTNPELPWLKARKDMILEIFRSEQFKKRGLYDADRIAEKFEAWLDGYPGDGLIFWRILITELWMRRYIDPSVIVR